MSMHRASLDSAAATIDDLVIRVTMVADHFETEGEEGLANDLYEVERSLQAAARRLHHVVRELES